MIVLFFFLWVCGYTLYLKGVHDSKKSFTHVKSDFCFFIITSPILCISNIIFLTQALDEFSAKIPSHSWAKLNETQVSFNELNAMLAKYQNPKEADAMTKIQQDLDDTKIILVII